METPDSLPNPFSNARVVGVDVDPNDYHRLQGERGKQEFIVSNSMLKDFAKCPRKWRVGGEPERDSDACRWGELIDARALSPSKFEKRFAVCPAMYPCEPTKKDPRTEKKWTRQATYCNEWESARFGEGRLVIKADEFNSSRDAIGRLQNDEGIAALLACSQTQVHVAAEYRDRATGITVPVKGLIDLVPYKNAPFYGRTLADLKTTRNASARNWVREVFQYGYAIQAALYLDLYTAATGEDRTSFIHVLSESTPPYEPGKRLLTQEFVEIGRRFYHSTLSLYCACLARDVWPSYDDSHDNINGWAFCGPEPWMIGQDEVPMLPEDEKPADEQTDNKEGITP
jgi:hypothetical protein